MPKKRIRNPLSLPPEEFLGDYWEELISGRSNELVEKYKHYPNARWLSVFNDPDPEASYWAGVKRDVDQDWLTIKNWWPFCILRKASDNDDSEMYKRVLVWLLHRLELRPPKGVLVDYRLPKGRPKGNGTVIAVWVEMGMPTLDWKNLESIAKKCFPAEYKAAIGGTQRKKLRDRVGAMIRRYLASATKPPGILSRD